MKYFMFNNLNNVTKKRYNMFFENAIINGRICKFIKLQGVFAEKLVFLGKVFSKEMCYNKNKHIRAHIKQIYEHIKQVQSLSVILLKLVGTGYKCIMPKKFNRRVLFLRVGFAASELKYSLKDSEIRMRAKKQKIVLFGFNHMLLTQLGIKLINLRYPNVYTGKGIRYLNQNFITKARKQQQRGK